MITTFETEQGFDTSAQIWLPYLLASVESEPDEAASGDHSQDAANRDGGDLEGSCQVQR